MGKILRKIKELTEDQERKFKDGTLSLSDEPKKRIIKLLNDCGKLDDNQYDIYNGQVFMTKNGKPILPFELVQPNLGLHLMYFQGQRFFQKIITSVEGADKGKCTVCSDKKYCLLIQYHLLVAETKTKKEKREIWEQKELNVCLSCLSVSESPSKFVEKKETIILIK